MVQTNQSTRLASMRRSGWRAGVVLGLAVLLGALALSGDQVFPPPHRQPGPPADAPRVVVAMGDSTMSGEGAGDYEPGTDGENGNWCHRSTSASIHQVTIPALDRTINLSCSGAPSAQVGLGDVEQYTEISQSQQLAPIAASNRVVAVVVASGANDNPAFSHVLSDCVEAWVSGSSPCSQSVGPDWQDRVDAMVPKLIQALTDIRTVMRNTGYAANEYQLIVQSYAAPVGPNVADNLQDLSGCPFRDEDLRWVEDTAVPAIRAGVREAAQEAGARFLDLSRAGVGREACSTENDPGAEWFRRLAVQWGDLREQERATHALQESFHPNAAGHLQFGQCLSEFLLTTDRSAACLPGADGNLHAATSLD